MTIQFGSQFSATKTIRSLQDAQSVSATLAARSTGTSTFSKTLQAAFAASGTSVSSVSSNAANSIDAKLAEIRSKDAMTRTAADMDFLLTNDKKLAEITDKQNRGAGLTSSEVDYEQKARGFVNTMALLSPAEKGLYDKLVASGNMQAAAGISQIAFVRTMGHMAGGAEGTSYDPINTSITAANIEQYFRHSIVDSSGKSQSQFQALIQYLQSNPAVS